MIDAIAGFLRAALGVVGLLTLTDPAASGSLVAVAVALAVALVVLAVVVTNRHAPARGPAAHPTRRTELTAPLAQSDPDAEGHVRRRGPGRLTAAA